MALPSCGSTLLRALCDRARSRLGWSCAAVAALAAVGCGASLPAAPAYPIQQALAGPVGLREDRAPDGALRAGDQLVVEVTSGTATTATQGTVDARGDVHVAAGSDIAVGGLSLESAEQRVTSALRTRDKFAEVSLQLFSRPTQRVIVLGAVARPGFVELRPGMRLADAIVAAGGFRTLNTESGAPTSGGRAGSSRGNAAGAQNNAANVANNAATAQNNAAAAPNNAATAANSSSPPSATAGSGAAAPTEASQPAGIGIFGLQAEPSNEGAPQATIAASAQVNSAPVSMADLDGAVLQRDGQALPISFRKALRGERGHNVWLHPADELYVPFATEQMIGVFGQVGAPMLLPHHTGLRMTEALSAAGGLTVGADKSDIRLVRGPLDAPKAYRASLRAIANGDQHDVALQAGDVLFVQDAFIEDLQEVLELLVPIAAAAVTALSLSLILSN
jgi:protein involved in polysaccharide export with SLBB domain